MPDARPWWPFGYGPQPLYRVEAGVDGSARTATFGIRTVEMRALPEVSGDDVYDWQFVVNGRPLFLKGANWCFTDPMARRGFDVDRHLLDLCVRANLQMLRPGAAAPSRATPSTMSATAAASSCSRSSPSASGWMPREPRSRPSTSRRRASSDASAPPVARDVGGGNENPETVSGDDLLTVVGTRVRQYDPSRPFHRTDPWGGSEHFYGVYHEGQPVNAYATHIPAGVRGEYGLSSQCDLDSMARFLDPSLLEQWPPPAHGAILQHQAQFSLFDLFKQARYAHYGPLTDWATFVEYSQLAQGDALRFARSGCAPRGRAHRGLLVLQGGGGLPGRLVGDRRLLRARQALVLPRPAVRRRLAPRSPSTTARPSKRARR